MRREDEDRTMIGMSDESVSNERRSKDDSVEKMMKNNIST